MIQSFSSGFGAWVVAFRVTVQNNGGSYVRQRKMAKIGKSGRERYYFEKFRLQAALPHGEITYGDKPDVIIAGDRTTIGIEITNLYLEDGKNSASEQVRPGCAQTFLR